MDSACYPPSHTCHQINPSHLMHWNLGLCSTWATCWFALPHGKISLKELLRIALACAMWGKYWKGQRLVCHCDNAAMVAIINSGSSKKDLAMDLMRSLFFVSAHYKFVVSARFLPHLWRIGPHSVLPPTHTDPLLKCVANNAHVHAEAASFPGSPHLGMRLGERLTNRWY